MRMLSSLLAYLTAKSKRSTQQIASETALEKQHLASAYKEQALAEESRAKTLAAYLDAAQKVLRNASIAYGFIVTFAYFFAAIHFFPSGLTLGDSLLFVFVAIGFGFASVAFALSGLIFWAPTFVGKPPGAVKTDGQWTKDDRRQFAWSVALSICSIAAALTLRSLGDSSPSVVNHFTAISIVWLIAFAIASLFACGWRRGKVWSWDGWPMALIHTLIVGAMFPLFIVVWGEPVALLAGCLAIAGAILSLSLSSIDDFVRSGARPKGSAPMAPADREGLADETAVKRLRRKHFRFAMAFAVMAFLFPLILDYWLLQGRLSAAVLTSMGLRMEDATVRMTGSALETVRSQRAINDSVLSFCEQPDGSALVSPITLLWYGPGTRSLVAVGPASAQFDRQQRNLVPHFEVAASEVQPSESGARRCHDIEHKALFSTNSFNAAFPTHSKPVLDEIAHTASVIYPAAASATGGKHWNLARVLVTGYADDMALPNNGNETLAHRRAACIAAEIIKRLDEAKIKSDSAQIVYWDGEGSRAPARDCDKQTGKAQQVECNAVNRRARVRMIFECVGGDGNAGEKCPLGVETDPPPPEVAQGAPDKGGVTSKNAAGRECLGETSSEAVVRAPRP